MRPVFAGAGNPNLNAAVGEFVSHKLFGRPDGFVNHTSLAVFHDRDLVAGVIYHDWSPDYGTIQLSAAADTKRWLTRPVLKAMYGYPFDQLGCQLVVQRNSERDEPLARQLRAYGFEGHPIPRLRGRDHGEIIFTLTEEAWRGNGFHEVKRG